MRAGYRAAAGPGQAAGPAGGGVFRGVNPGLAGPAETRIAEELAADEAVRAADTVLFTVPNQLGVGYDARILTAIAQHIAPATGWAPASIATVACVTGWR
jgi:hypothetical protein